MRKFNFYCTQISYLGLKNIFPFSCHSRGSQHFDLWDKYCVSEATRTEDCFVNQQARMREWNDFVYLRQQRGESGLEFDVNCSDSSSEKEILCSDAKSKKTRKFNFLIELSSDFDVKVVPSAINTFVKILWYFPPPNEAIHMLISLSVEILMKFHQHKRIFICLWWCQIHHKISHHPVYSCVISCPFSRFLLFMKFMCHTWKYFIRSTAGVSQNLSLFLISEERVKHRIFSRRMEPHFHQISEEIRQQRGREKMSIKFTVI